MERSQLVQVLRDRATALLGVEAEQVTGQTAFVVDLAVDSLWLVELMVDLEEALGVPLIERDLTGVVTVDDLVDVVLAAAERG